MLATVLFTDIVGSTERPRGSATAAGVTCLIDITTAVRRELTRFRGREVDTAGDGFLATFDGPARAIRCALAVARTRAPSASKCAPGVHTGECELLGGKVPGSLFTPARGLQRSRTAGEILVSQTVKDLVAGSGIEFHERGDHEFKGVPGRWRVYAAADG